jgi:hypothetical protein
LKPLFLLGRTRRSVSSLTPELAEFERKLGLSEDSRIALGDFAFWPLKSDSCDVFWREHRTLLNTESGLLMEFTVGEVGKAIFSACDTNYVDRFKDQTYLYGTTDDDGQSFANDAADLDEDEEDDDLNDWDYHDQPVYDPYAGQLFWSVNPQFYFDFGATEDAVSFGRKLLILIGRDAQAPFLETRIGRQFKERLGKRARIVLNAQGADVTAIAFHYDASGADFFAQMKRLLPPRLVEDFLVMDIGRNCAIGDQPISRFAEWSNQPEPVTTVPPEADDDNNVDGPPGKQIVVEVKRRRPLIRLRLRGKNEPNAA